MSRDRESLRAELAALGFDEVRFARIEGPVDGGVRAWVEAGHHADMAWIARALENRTDARQVLPGAMTMIVLGVNYWTAASGGTAGAGEPVRWARYALHEDYHDTIKRALVEAGRVLERAYQLTGDDYRYYVDTGPVQERGWAARAGVGFFGKNGMLISRRFGNWLFLATILVRADIEPDAPLSPRVRESGAVGLLCGKCTRCSDACPTQAIVSAGVVDARRCVSYQTIENKGVIPRALRAGIGARIYGCDVCAEVCPWNRFAQDGRGVLLVARRELAGLTLREILTLTPVRFAEVFRKTAIKRVKLAGLLRNACIVAANTQAVDCLDVLVALAGHESALVRAHAVWAVFRLAGVATAPGLLSAAQERETEARVLAEYAARGAQE